MSPSGWPSTHSGSHRRPEASLVHAVSDGREGFGSTVKILFATMAALQDSPAGPTSSLASARYRVLLPATQLARKGHEVQIASLPPSGWSPEISEAIADVVVISKSFHTANEELAKVQRARGAQVIVDFCDDHFGHPQFGPHFRRLASLADQVIASTTTLADAIRTHTTRDSMVISDPVEGPRGLPRFSPRFPALSVVWFGHPSNLDSLAARAGEVIALSRSVPVRLSVVTAPSPEVASLLASLFAASAPRLVVEAVPWSLEATWRSFADCDIAWIPTINNDRKAAKSPNRLVEPLWAGRFVVADPMPAYQPFADVVPVGRDLTRSVLEALDDIPGTEHRIRAAQRRIAKHHSLFECGQQWSQAIGDTSSRPLRLNLGCGDKILPGYVNVDVVEARAGHKPDVICDLHDLAPFADNSVDEILSVHVVEHFWRWEVTEILREWLRVLKPGAPLVIECPNLLSACRTFLENPTQYSRMDQNGQRTMWVFYGDPAWRDPLMNHRWGYTPDSLQALLREVGLVDVRQEPALFKLREPRDMRIVGCKRIGP